ncbi:MULTISPECIES: flagellar hook-basal body complex protein FliE [Saccharibacillus]|uniref:Flagellar hook-basal body complex protein FliE n=1 Tax=Saccharibacillus brassicae TaxID=2583377 RepID=A0A4Y6V213_SACBS|nr:MULTISPECIES: flagellar hook-basal body complex protein FliE [Saccharibacillus]MWJ29643.1 flagellar hook-basal body complex protein FliE [Saccharibacillus sp. WB 17]QDH22848.1 flagellar hook-basal body complex protein FliE [Saccharibacillus brassicae]
MIQNHMFNPVQMANRAVSNLQDKTAEATPQETMQNFGNYLQDALQGVSNMEKTADETGKQFMLGQASVDQVMITGEQALLGLQMTSQVRNKVIEAYQEIMRTQL